MVLSIIEYCDIVYPGSNQINLTKIDTLLYSGFTICSDCNNMITRKVLCNECDVVPVGNI